MSSRITDEDRRHGRRLAHDWAERNGMPWCASHGWSHGWHCDQLAESYTQTIAEARERGEASRDLRNDDYCSVECMALSRADRDVGNCLYCASLKRRGTEGA
jgi:hypothetical protein